MVLLLVDVGRPPQPSCWPPGLHAMACTNGVDFVWPLHPPQAECIQTGPGEYLCACQAGWTGDGQDCSAINNCLLPSVAGCHENATCIYVGPGQVRPFAFIPTFHTRSLAVLLCQHFPPFPCSSTSSPLPHSHKPNSTQRSLLPLFSLCSLCAVIPAGNTVK